MSVNLKTIAAAAAVLCGAAAVGLAGAANAENDASAINSARISLVQAVAAAEARVPGKAAKVEFEQARGGKWVYDVEIVAGDKVFDVAVDADSGNVLSATEDKVDHDDDKDQKD